MRIVHSIVVTLWHYLFQRCRGCCRHEFLYVSIPRQVL